MKNIKSTIENEPTPLDVSSEFLSMSSSEFYEFLRANRKKPSFSITIDWVDADTAIKLKAFLEDGAGKQERSVTIRATQEQYDQEPNVFMSGVKWERV